MKKSIAIETDPRFRDRVKVVVIVEGDFADVVTDTMAAFEETSKRLQRLSDEREARAAHRRGNGGAVSPDHPKCPPATPPAA